MTPPRIPATRIDPITESATGERIIRGTFIDAGQNSIRHVDAGIPFAKLIACRGLTTRKPCHSSTTCEMLRLLGREFDDDENDNRTYRAFLCALPQRHTVRHGVAPRKQARVFKTSIRTGL
jgi:hypothetical protein